MAEALVAGVRDELEVAGDVGVEGGVDEGDGDALGELDGADLAGVGDDGEEAVLGDRIVTFFARCGFGFAQVDGEQAAGDADAGAADGYACAADGVVEVDVGGVVGEAEGEGFELLLERRGGVVAGAGDTAAVEVDGGEGLQDVVELGAGEVDGDGLVAGDVAGVLEEADAVFVESYAGDGEGGWLGGSGPGWRGGACGSGLAGWRGGAGGLGGGRAFWGSCWT